MTRKICGYYGLLETAAPSEQTFECAARNLDLFFFVGTLERMAESLCALRHLLKWNAVNPRAAKAVGGEPRGVGRRRGEDLAKVRLEHVRGAREGRARPRPARNPAAGFGVPPFESPAPLVESNSLPAVSLDRPV